MKLFIDLDGTLLDSRRRLHRLFCDLSGSDIAFDDYWSHKRAMRSNEWLLRQRGDVTDDDVAGFVEAWMGLIEQPDYLALDHPFDFSLPVVRALAADHTLYVLTSRQTEAAAVAQLETGGFAPYLADVLVTGGARSKVDLLTGHASAASAGDVVIGDTGRDVETARAFGMTAYAVLSGFRSREALVRYSPDAIHDDLLEVYNQRLAPAGGQIMVPSGTRLA